MDHSADEVHEQPQEPVTNDVHSNTQGFRGGLEDTLVFDGLYLSCGNQSWGRTSSYLLNYIIFELLFII